IRLSPDRIDAHTPWEHYGIDSVMVVNLTQRLEDAFGWLSKTLFFENQTLTELARALGGSRPRAVAELLGERSGDGPSPDSARERPGGAEARPLPRTTPTPQRETALQPVLPS